MSFDQLKPEIWHQILSLFAPTLPKPLSGWTKSGAVGEKPEVIAKLPEDGAPGTTSRSDIRAPVLALLMRTSIGNCSRARAYSNQGFNHIASRILYNRVFTDDLAALLVLRRRDRAHPQIASKYELLRRIHILHLEYRQKYGECITYGSIMKQGREINLLDPYSAGPIQTAVNYAALEAGMLTGTLEDFRDVFCWKASSSLTHMTIGAIFGGEDAFWQLLAPKMTDTDPSKWNPLQEGVSKCRIRLESALYSLPLVHLCQRSQVGPLSLPPTFIWYDQMAVKRDPPSPLFTFHFGKETRAISTPYGHRTRWLYEDLGYRNEFDGIFDSVDHAVRIAQTRRHHDAAKLKMLVQYCPKTTFEVDIWASGDRMPLDGINPREPRYAVTANMRIDADFERKATDVFARRWRFKKGENPSGLIPGASKDKVTLRSSLDSPGCDCCGWKFERTTEGMTLGREVLGEFNDEGELEGNV